MPILNHHVVVTEGAPQPAQWMLVLHGIYGAGRNWLSVARRFVGARPDWGAVLVDLRQHGASMEFTPPHDLEACADDLRALVAHLGINARAVAGHSFGGKVALVYSRSAPLPLEVVWVIDSTPDAGAPGGSAWGMLRVLRLHPGPFANRGEGVSAVESEGFGRAVARWMSTNLISDGEQFRWRLDADDMEALLRSFFSTDGWDAVERPAPDVQVHVIKAEASSILTEDACRRIEAAGRVSGQVHLHRVQGGHWLNADNPDALHALLVENTE